MPRAVSSPTTLPSPSPPWAETTGQDRRLLDLADGGAQKVRDVPHHNI